MRGSGHDQLPGLQHFQGGKGRRTASFTCGLAAHPTRLPNGDPPLCPRCQPQPLAPPGEVGGRNSPAARDMPRQGHLYASCSVWPQPHAGSTQSLPAGWQSEPSAPAPSPAYSPSVPSRSQGQPSRGPASKAGGGPGVPAWLAGTLGRTAGGVSARRQAQGGRRDGAGSRLKSDRRPHRLPPPPHRNMPGFPFCASAACRRKGRRWLLTSSPTARAPALLPSPARNLRNARAFPKA